jgi:hypothetical protein
MDAKRPANQEGFIDLRASEAVGVVILVRFMLFTLLARRRR